MNLKNVFVRESDRVSLLEKLRSTTVFTEFELRRKDKETIWVRDYPKVTLALTGDVDYMMVVFVQTYGIEAIVCDITEQRKLEIMKDQFISAVTHELRTPLISIKGYADYVLAEDQNVPLENVRASIVWPDVTQIDCLNSQMTYWTFNAWSPENSNLSCKISIFGICLGNVLTRFNPFSTRNLSSFIFRFPTASLPFKPILEGWTK